MTKSHALQYKIKQFISYSYAFLLFVNSLSVDGHVIAVLIGAAGNIFHVALRHRDRNVLHFAVRQNTVSFPSFLFDLRLKRSYRLLNLETKVK